MRVKKQKRHRKVVRFFSACFGFREPYKVLCDGTFIHHLIVQGLIPADDAIYRLLGGRVQLFSTRCVAGELKSLGESHYDACSVAKELITARCDHDNKRVNAAACIDSVVAEGNKEHFFVATQDADLRKKLKEIPGIPLIFALKNALFLEKLTSEQREFVKSAEEKRLHMSEFEANLVRKKKFNDELVRVTEGPRPSDGHDDAKVVRSLQSKAKKKHISVQDKVQFKRKRAKGPNPLSCKKKKSNENSTPSSAKNAGGDDVSKRKRTRKRRKAQNDCNPGKSDSG